MIVKIVLPILVLISLTLFGCAPEDKSTASEVKNFSESTAILTEKTGWEAEWGGIIVDAKKEGRVVLYGPPIAEARKGFIEGFQKAYPGITLEYTGLSGSQIAPKIKAERRADIYVVDIHVGGTTTILNELKPFAVPIKPYLILPQVKDTKQWFEERMDFSDDAEELNLVFTINTQPRVVYNTELVDQRKIMGISYWEFTRPEWKGKIIYYDPRVAGPGLALATFFYTHTELGVEYLKALAANGIVLSRDPRLIAEWVGRGKYNAALSLELHMLIELQKAGMPLRFGENMKEGTYSTASYGSVIFLDKAPHPKAAAVFLNWLLSKEGQTIWTKASGLPSRRIDAPVDHLLNEVVPKPGRIYIPNYKEKYVKLKDEIAEQLNKIFVGF